MQSCAQVDHNGELLHLWVTTGKVPFCYLQFFGDGLHSQFSVLQGNIAAGECLPLFKRNSGSPQLHWQKKKSLPASIPKGEFQLLGVSNEGIGVTLYRFDDTAACGNVGSTKHSHYLPTPNQPLITLNLSLPHELGIDLGHTIVYGTDREWFLITRSH